MRGRVRAAKLWGMPGGKFVELALPDAEELRAAKRPIGEWNQAEIGSNEGSVRVKRLPSLP